MRVGLFVPCYVDQMFPDVAMATLEVLERQGVEVVVPAGQTCCAQPLFNAGQWDAARPLAERHLAVFEDFEHVVCPSGSCVAMVRHHYRELLAGRTGRSGGTPRTWELCEFLTDVLGVERIEGRFPHRVGLHASCHSLRTLRLAPASERRGPPVQDRVACLLRGLDGLELVDVPRADECCGFGGVFAVEEAAVSAAMGRDRVAAHRGAGAEVLTSVDMSCLCHLEGIARRDAAPIAVLHVAQILAGRDPLGR